MIADRPLTTADVLIDRSRLVADVTVALRADTPWARLSMGERQTIARRLSFARWHLNGQDRLRHRIEPRRRVVRALWTELTTSVALIVALVLAAGYVGWQRMGWGR